MWGCFSPQKWANCTHIWQRSTTQLAAPLSFGQMMASCHLDGTCYTMCLDLKYMKGKEIGLSLFLSAYFIRDDLQCLQLCFPVVVRVFSSRAVLLGDHRVTAVKNSKTPSALPVLSLKESYLQQPNFLTVFSYRAFSCLSLSSYFFKLWLSSVFSKNLWKHKLQIHWLNNARRKIPS